MSEFSCNVHNSLSVLVYNSLSVLVYNSLSVLVHNSLSVLVYKVLAILFTFILGAFAKAGNVDILRKKWEVSSWWHILSGCRVCDWGIQWHLCSTYRGLWGLVVVVAQCQNKPGARGLILSDCRLFTLLYFTCFILAQISIHNWIQ